jgi:hypothetical protein
MGRPEVSNGSASSTHTALQACAGTHQSHPSSVHPKRGVWGGRGRGWRQRKHQLPCTLSPPMRASQSGEPQALRHTAKGGMRATGGDARTRQRAGRRGGGCWPKVQQRTAPLLQTAAARCTFRWETASACELPGTHAAHARELSARAHIGKGQSRFTKAGHRQQAAGSMKQEANTARLRHLLPGVRGRRWRGAGWGCWGRCAIGRAKGAVCV